MPSPDPVVRVTFSMPRSLHQRMQAVKDVNWSLIIRQALLRWFSEREQKEQPELPVPFSCDPVNGVLAFSRMRRRKEYSHG